MADRTVYLNGEFLPASEARISAFDAGFLHGASAFTTMRAHLGVVFRFDRHLMRLMDTVRLLDLHVGSDPGRLTEATYDVLAANRLADARVRITLTPGPIGAMRGEPDDEAAPATTLITAEPVPDRRREWAERGIAVVVSSLRQVRGDPTFGYKTGCYLPRVLARREAAAKGAEDALWFTTDKYLAEACFSNVFLVHGGKVSTPPRDTPVLPGVVRDAVIEICRREGIPCDTETPLTVREMLAAEEMFLTSSVAGPRPVVQVEAHQVGAGRPGELTRRITACYEALLDAECREGAR